MLDREAENLAVGNRNATRQRVRLGARRDGTLTAIDVRIEQAVGAHLVGGEGSNVSGPYQRLYRCPNVRTEQVPVYTNTGPPWPSAPLATSRGPSRWNRRWTSWPGPCSWTRSDLRLRNYAAEDQKRDKPYTIPDSLRAATSGPPRHSAGEDYQRRWRSGTKRRGIGFAAHDWGGSG